MLSSLSETDKKNLEIFCQSRVLDKGDTLFLEGDDANAMYFLISGSVEIFREENAEVIKIGKVDTEEILGEMALFGGEGKRMATAKALEETQLITILSFSIKEITEKYPELMQKIQNVIEERNIKNKSI